MERVWIVIKDLGPQGAVRVFQHWDSKSEIDGIKWACRQAGEAVIAVVRPKRTVRGDDIVRAEYGMQNANAVVRPKLNRQHSAPDVIRHM